MSRHNRRVPTSFYSRFARDVQAFAASPESYTPKPSASGLAPTPRILAVLEGGYSDRALSSGIASLLTGMASTTSVTTCEWDLKDIVQMEKACCATPPSGIRKPLADWAMQAGELFGQLSGESREAWLLKGKMKAKESTDVAVTVDAALPRTRRQVPVQDYAAMAAGGADSSPTTKAIRIKRVGKTEVVAKTAVVSSTTTTTTVNLPPELLATSSESSEAEELGNSTDSSVGRTTAGALDRFMESQQPRSSKSPVVVGESPGPEVVQGKSTVHLMWQNQKLN